tara:strand:- start:21 stop:1265 length:1245 start_codon:yes stop_codon:yes gene_type:complete
MAVVGTFTGLQLSGSGTPIPALTAGTEYTFTLSIPTGLSGSGYFTSETSKDPNGFYPSTTVENAIGVYDTLTGIPDGSLVTSSYISSIVTDNQPAVCSYKFTPTYNVVVSSSMLRTTGNIGLQIEDAGGGGPFVFTSNGQLKTASNLWTSDNAAAIATYGQINTWDVSGLTDFSQIFFSNSTFDSDISSWDVSNATNMSGMFSGASSFNQDISSWDVSNVTNMVSMFLGGIFNQRIDNWDVSSVEFMTSMFGLNTVYNQPLNAWTLTSLTNTSDMFRGASSFSRNVNGWSMNLVTDTSGMFKDATNYNQNMNFWDVSNVTNMSGMLENATSFNRDIGGWKPNSLTNATDMFNGATAFSTTNYDLLLIGWSAESIQPNVPFSAGTTQYSVGTAATARGVLTGAPNNWTITDGGQV